MFLCLNFVYSHGPKAIVTIHVQYMYSMLYVVVVMANVHVVVSRMFCSVNIDIVIDL